MLIKSLTVICLLFSTLSYADKKPTVLNLLIHSCSDGDTCTASTKEGLKLKLRLAGIDAPEVSHGKKKGQFFGKESKEWLNNAVKNQNLKVEILGSDPFGRYLAVLWKSDSNINKKCIEEGMAYAYSKIDNAETKKWAMEAQKFAEKNKKGLWALDKKIRPENPSEFRKSLKK